MSFELHVGIPSSQEMLNRDVPTRDLSTVIGGKWECKSLHTLKPKESKQRNRIWFDFTEMVKYTVVKHGNKSITSKFMALIYIYIYIYNKRGTVA